MTTTAKSFLARAASAQVMEAAQNNAPKDLGFGIFLTNNLLGVVDGDTDLAESIQGPDYSDDKDVAKFEKKNGKIVSYGSSYNTHGDAGLAAFGDVPKLLSKCDGPQALFAALPKIAGQLSKATFNKKLGDGETLLVYNLSGTKAIVVIMDND